MKDFTDKEYCLEVWSDWACFTRPELKVERVSYDVITPSAARAIFESILLPQFWIRYRLVVYEDSATNPLPVPLSTGYI